MKIFMYFVLFFVAKSGHAALDEWRVRSTIPAKNVLGLLEESKKFTFFYGKLEENHIADGMRELQGLVDNNVSDANGVLISQFMSLSYAYVVQLLRDYCALVEDMIMHDSSDGVPTGLTGEAIAFKHGHQYCMLTAFHDFGQDVTLLFESVYYFQSYFRHTDISDKSDLKFPVQMYRIDFQTYLRSIPLPNLQEKSDHDDFIEFRFLVRDIKEKITNFSNMFCTWWRPFVSYVHITETAALKRVRFNRPFIDHAFKNERCVITFQKVAHFATARNRIAWWDCKNILVSEEYGYQKYIGYITDQTKKNKEFKDEIQEPSVHRGSEPNRDGYSLTVLLNELQTNSYYLNAVKYYNIKSEVMLLVSIKEGRKILKVVKRATKIFCSESFDTKTIVNKMHELRMTLSTFKNEFDQLFDLMLKSNRIDVTRNPLKLEFDAQVDAFVKLPMGLKDLDVPNRLLNCDKITGLLEPIKYGADLENYLNIFNIISEQYYLMEPLFHFRQLVHFYKNNHI